MTSKARINTTRPAQRNENKGKTGITRSVNQINKQELKVTLVDLSGRVRIV